MMDDIQHNRRLCNIVQLQHMTSLAVRCSSLDGRENKNSHGNQRDDYSKLEEYIDR